MAISGLFQSEVPQLGVRLNDWRRVGFQSELPQLGKLLLVMLSTHTLCRQSVKISFMVTIYSIDADGRERYDTVLPEHVGKQINVLKRRGQLRVRVIPVDSFQSEVPQPDDVEVAPGIFQSRNDFEANMAYDTWRDNQL